MGAAATTSQGMLSRGLRRVLGLAILLCLFCMRPASVAQAAESSKLLLKQDIEIVKHLKPLIDHERVFFWRPQKVGSSSLLSILLSFSFRYNVIQRRSEDSNGLCTKLGTCAIKDNPGNRTILGIVNHAYQRPTDLGFGSDKRMERSEMNQYQISTAHMICNMPSEMIEKYLPCSFTYRNSFNQALDSPKQQRMKELFLVRNPLSRIISIYYFWGELFKVRDAQVKQMTSMLENASLSESDMRKVERKKDRMDSKGRSKGSHAHHRKQKHRHPGPGPENSRRRLLQNRGEVPTDGVSMMKTPPEGSHVIDEAHRQLLDLRTPWIKLGDTKTGTEESIKGMFHYHGNESTLPPPDIAMAFARALPLRPGLPGPSLSWSLFGNSAADAIAVMQTERIMTLVSERMDESLVVAAHYMRWSLADMVNTVPRKSLSTHPKANQWPAEAVAQLNSQLNQMGEFAVYDEANRRLNERISRLKRERGVDVMEQVELLRALRDRATKLCLSAEYLHRYRAYLKGEGLLAHPSENKLRDVEERFFEEGHAFSFNKDILLSFDVCGPCEAHAMLLGLQMRIATSVESAPTLSQLQADSSRRKLIQGNVNFIKCPTH